MLDATFLFGRIRLASRFVKPVRREKFRSGIGLWRFALDKGSRRSAAGSSGLHIGKRARPARSHRVPPRNRTGDPSASGVRQRQRYSRMPAGQFVREMRAQVRNRNQQLRVASLQAVQITH
jgi:hypothetical protein